jgi:hypothetical protein
MAKVMEAKPPCQLTALMPADVISYSAIICYMTANFLLINHNHFPAEYQKPENMIWVTSEDSMNITKDLTEKFLVDNVITGERCWLLEAIFGRYPTRYASRYDFEALKAEYAAAHEIQSGVNEATSGGIFPADYEEPDLEDGMEP